MSQPGVLLPDPATVADLATFVNRAQRVDPGGFARLVAADDVLAVYASPVHGSGGPTVLAMRAHRLAAPATVDALAPLAGLADRLARLVRTGAGELSMPPGQTPSLAWAALSPPRSGWVRRGPLTAGELAEVARAGAMDIAAGAPEGSGAAAVARLRALVWGRDLPGADGLAAGAAFAMDAFGLLVVDEPVEVFSCGGWHRLTSSRGHVLCRRPLL